MESSETIPVTQGTDVTASEEAPLESEDSGPNPFWSERAAEEFRLQRARPLGLAEFDDRQLDPEYGSEAGNSLGYASAMAASVRGASPVPARGSEASSEARLSGRVSHTPSLTSRSRSPNREEIPGVRELLVTFGNAVADLAEEQRNTQRRLSVVEETRSGSTSSMRTGREGAELESGQIGVVESVQGTQFFQIGEAGHRESYGLHSGVLALEDWVQTPVALADIPGEGGFLGLLGAPKSYGPHRFGEELGVSSTGLAVPHAKVPGGDLQGAFRSAPAQGFEGSAQGTSMDALEVLHSAQVRGLEGSAEAPSMVRQGRRPRHVVGKVQPRS